MSELWRALLQGLAQLLSSFYDLTGSYGLAIIMLTVVIRTLMIPLAIKQAKMMVVSRAQAEKMKKIQPELKRLREKHRDDRTKLYEETKKLQDHHGVSLGGQLGGCLPTLLQMPILFAMYRVLNGCYKGVRPGFCPPKHRILSSGSGLGAAIAAGHAAFLGMNLTLAPSAALKEGVVGAIPYYLLVALMGLTMWLQQKQMSRVSPSDPQMAQMQRMMMFMPVLFMFISLSLPSGLTLYWVATNVWTIGQQFILLKRFGPAATATSAPLPAVSAAAGKPIEQSPKSNGAKGTVVQGPSNALGPQKPKGSGARKRRRKKGRR